MIREVCQAVTENKLNMFSVSLRHQNAFAAVAEACMHGSKNLKIGVSTISKAEEVLFIIHLFSYNILYFRCSLRKTLVLPLSALSS